MTSRATLARLSALIKAKRREKKIGLRAAADESKVSASTLSRLERGAATTLPDSETLTKLAKWLEVPLNSVFSDKNQSPGQEPGSLFPKSWKYICEPTVNFRLKQHRPLPKCSELYMPTVCERRGIERNKEEN